jgi:ribokinase
MDDLDLTYINQAKMLHLSSFADDRQFKVLLELIDKLDLSIKISFSPGALYATKGLKVLSPILDRTHVLFINQNEIGQLTGEDVIAGAETCLRQGCHMVVVTLGKGTRLELSQGTVTAAVYIRDAESEYAVESTSRNIVSEVNTTGAGDAFASGFLYGLVKGKGLEECGRLGDITARFSITKLGTRHGFPTLNQVSKRYQELYSEQL